MCDLITVISAASAAIIAAIALIFAALTFFIVRRQWQISKPTINHLISGDTKNDHCDLSIAIAKPDNLKFNIEKLTIISPDEARISKKISATNNRPSPGEWCKELLIDYETSSTGVFVSAPRGSKFAISVKCNLKSDVSVKSPCAITNNMHD